MQKDWHRSWKSGFPQSTSPSLFKWFVGCCIGKLFIFLFYIWQLNMLCWRGKTDVCVCQTAASYSVLQLVYSAGPPLFVTLWFDLVAALNKLLKLHRRLRAHAELFTFLVCLQRDDATRQCRSLSQELVNLQGELGKSGHISYSAQFEAVAVSSKHSSPPHLMGFSSVAVQVMSQETLWIIVV